MLRHWTWPQPRITSTATCPTVSARLRGLCRVPRACAFVHAWLQPCLCVHACVCVRACIWGLQPAFVRLNAPLRPPPLPSPLAWCSRAAGAGCQAVAGGPRRAAAHLLPRQGCLQGCGQVLAAPHRRHPTRGVRLRAGGQGLRALKATAGNRYLLPLRAAGLLPALQLKPSCPTCLPACSPARLPTRLPPSHCRRRTLRRR